MANEVDNSPEKESDVIFRASITKPDGTVIYARHYGKKAFMIRVSADNDNTEKKVS